MDQDTENVAFFAIVVTLCLCMYTLLAYTNQRDEEMFKQFNYAKNK